MVARNSVWVSVLFGLGCLFLGALLGISWPGRERPRVWIDAEPVRQPSMMPSFAPVVQRVEAGVVTVRALRDEDPSVGGPQEADESETLHAGHAGLRAGSGFVVSPRGLVLTSHHIVANAFDIEVKVPGRPGFRAQMVGEDQATDLALLRLDDAPDDLLALPLANGAELQAGDWIVAVGNPLGYAQTVTAGIVSFVGRHLPHSDFGVTNDFLQISAPVNPGSSGCPVFDLEGRVVGVTTQARVDAQGISFAVPARTVKWTLEAMQRSPDGRVHRGYLGVEFQNRGVDRTGARCAGALITQVVDGQPAQRAGVRSGDVVVRVDDVPVPDAKALHERIVSSAPGTRLSLLVWRNGREEVADSLVAVLGEVGPRNPPLPN